MLLAMVGAIKVLAGLEQFVASVPGCLANLVQNLLLLFRVEWLKAPSYVDRLIQIPLISQANAPPVTKLVCRKSRRLCGWLIFVTRSCEVCDCGMLST